MVENERGNTRRGGQEKERAYRNAHWKVNLKIREKDDIKPQVFTI